jgi:hypothetical protein
MFVGVTAKKKHHSCQILTVKIKDVNVELSVKHILRIAPNLQVHGVNCTTIEAF